MSKIICDVCGTSYPETAEQCPICGCVRAANMEGVLPDTDGLESRSGYTYVKGGRFSKANVKKRNRAAQNDYAQEDLDEIPEEAPKEQSNKGLVITALVLLLAIISVIIYITVRFLSPADIKKNDAQDAQTEASTQQTTENTQPTRTEDLSCSAITPVKTQIVLDGLDAAFLLEYSVTPANTEDPIEISSSDPSVITVEPKTGNSCLIKAVAPGEAYVIFECGDQRSECKVICDFELPTEETTEDTQPSQPEYTEADIIFATKFISETGIPEVSLFRAGEQWRCYKGNIPLEEITWKSDNESVATVEKGVVVAVNTGTTFVHAIWGEYDVVCEVNVIVSQEDILNGNGGGISEG